MKRQIHPKWYPEAKIYCDGCNKIYTIGSTQSEIHVEVCSNCHPFYTGQMRYVDTEGRVDRFKAKQKLAMQKPKLSKKERRALKRKKKIEEELSKPTSLAEIQG